MKLIIGWFYPDLMSTYGDRGNIICLKKRGQWRGIEVEVKNIDLGTNNREIRKCDLLFMGGAQDRQQKIASSDLRKNKGPIIKEMIEENIPGLFVCAAYQFMGHYYRSAEGEDIEGLHIFDLYTRHFGKDKPRCIGNTIVKVSNSIFQPCPEPGHQSSYKTQIFLVGFENHGGRTYLGTNCMPLGEVIIGYGNNGEDKTEGCVYKNAIGTYLHGPILPKNPYLADWLIKTALEKRYQKEVKLKKLSDNLEEKARNFIFQKLNFYEKKENTY